MTATSVLPGPGALAAGARRLSDLAAEVRGHAMTVVTAAGDTGWRSTAATACRLRLGEVGRDLVGAASLLDHAAELVDDHARTAAHRAELLEDAAADLLLRGARRVLDGVLT